MSSLPFIPPFCAWVPVGPGNRHGHLHQPLRTAKAIAAAASVDDLRMEEGVYAPRTSDAVRNAWKIFFRCFTVVGGIGMLASLFVWRYWYRDPELQDPFKMIALAIIALGVMGSGYFTT